MKTTSFFAFLVLIFFYYAFLVTPPPDFFSSKSVYIKEGESLRSVSKLLENERIIRSRTLFEAFVIFYGGEKRILPGDYLFEKALPVFEVAKIISGGSGRLNSIKVTIPEGFTIDDIAETFDLKLKNFDKDKFILEAVEKEGYLFPDTYFFLNTDNEQDVILYMTNNFKIKVLPLLLEAGKDQTEISEIVVMASIIEREAKGEGDRELISGILWKRIKIGMPLQADAAPDTYNSPGLPKKPIANPGLASIRAALHPQSSSYLYYLHDKNGVIHFARNYDEHRQNITKYLK